MADSQTANAIAGGRRTTPPFRADHVGSLLRPPRAAEGARGVRRPGSIAAEQLRAVEDDAIRDVVKMQRDVGLQSATDGEFRRASWHMDFIYQLGGIEKRPRRHQGPVPQRAGRRSSSTPAAIHVGEKRAPRPHDLRRGLHVPAGPGAGRRHAEADDPVAEHGPLPRRPRRDRPERLSRHRSVLGRPDRRRTPIRSRRSRDWAGATCSSTTPASPTSTTRASAR